MKARKLVLCILLSVAMTVTFTPVMSYATEGEDQPTALEDVAGVEEEVVDSVEEEVVENADEADAAGTIEEDDEAVVEKNSDVDADQPVTSDNDDTVAAKIYDDEHPITINNSKAFVYDNYEERICLKLKHAKVYGFPYDDEEGFFYGAEGDLLEFWFVCDSGWEVSSVKYSIDNGKTKVNADYTFEIWEMTMPENKGNYTLKMEVAFRESVQLKSCKVTVKAPTCGTVVKGTDRSGKNRQKPQPAVVIPSGAKYELNSKSNANYGAWFDKEGIDQFTGKMKAGNTYNAYVEIRAQKGYTFAQNCSIRVTGGKLAYSPYVTADGKGIEFETHIKAVHSYAHVAVPAGLLKNGVQYDQCKGCKAIKNKRIIPGWANNYIKKLKVKKGKKSFTVKWKKQSKKNRKKFNGYQIRYSTAADMTGAKYVTAKTKSKSKKIKKLQKKTVYYVQVRTYTSTAAGVFYSNWSPTKSVKTK